MPVLPLACALAVAVPPAALVDSRPDAVVVARAKPPGEPLRMAGEYLGALAAFTAVNAGGVAFLSGARVRHAVTGETSLDSPGSLAAAGAAFVLSPLASALASWLIGKGSDAYDPSLGGAVLGAYGTSAVAVGAGLGLAAANLDRGAAKVANVLLYLAVPAGTVLVQNALKTERP
jgi:drug/metabolite transporter (DMT)-like permease